LLLSPPAEAAPLVQLMLGVDGSSPRTNKDVTPPKVIVHTPLSKKLWTGLNASSPLASNPPLISYVIESDPLVTAPP
jgi:hypothetical protein